MSFKPDPRHPARSCLLLPIGGRRPADALSTDTPADDLRRYLVVRIGSTVRPVRGCESATDVHLYDLGPHRGFELVGIERFACTRSER